MLTNTRAAIVAILNSDPSMNKAKIKNALAALEGGAGSAGHPARVIRRPEAARLLGVSPKRIDQLAQQNILKRIVVPGTSRAIGYSEESVRAITEQRGAIA